MQSTPSFLFVTSQVGAEGAVKGEVAREWPGMRFAYSRPGFLTFKLPPNFERPADFDLRSVFARACGFSLGKVTGSSLAERANAVCGLARELPIERLHVWQRDSAPAGEDGYEPGITDSAREVERAILAAMPAELSERVSTADQPDAKSPTGQLVLDCVLVAENEWWVGYHWTHSIPSMWPGGMVPMESFKTKSKSENETGLRMLAVSRGSRKIQEALLLSKVPLKRGQRCIEIGSAPGGAAATLLERGLFVTGIDPAAMHPTVLENPRFTHLRRRAKDVRHRDFVGVDWIIADINLPPNFTLNTIESILRYTGVKPRGLILTLKLREWSIATEIPAFLERIRGWGFKTVRARQLHHNRQEICVAARR